MLQVAASYCDPLAVLLVHAAMHLLFLPQFTIDIPGEDDLLRATAGERGASSFRCQQAGGQAAAQPSGRQAGVGDVSDRQELS